MSNETVNPVSNPLVLIETDPKRRQPQEERPDASIRHRQDRRGS